MKPGLLHRICAHPGIISGVLGAATFDAAIIPELAKLTPGATTWKLMFLWAPLIPATLLGCILGIFLFGSWARRICSRYNSGELKAGDWVMVLLGKLKGTVAEVYELAAEPGGWNLARLDLSAEHRQTFFETHALLKLKHGKGAAPGGGPALPLP
jgi:hypothetical protein